MTETEAGFTPDAAFSVAMPEGGGLSPGLPPGDALAAEEAGAPDGAPEADGAEGERPDPRQVPLAALKAERARRRALQEEVERLRAAAPRADPPSAAPDAPQPEPRAEGRGPSAVDEAALAAKLDADESSYRKATPDYDAAVDYLFEQRLKELGQAGLHLEEAAELVRTEMLTLVVGAARRGMAVAPLVYDLARRRGFAAMAGRERFERRSRALAAARGGGGGAARGPSEMTGPALAGLSGSAFDQAFDRMTRKGR